MYAEIKIMHITNCIQVLNICSNNYRGMVLPAPLTSLFAPGSSSTMWCVPFSASLSCVSTFSIANMTYPDDNIPQRKPNPLFSYCLPREGKAPTCTSFSNLQRFQDPPQDCLIFGDHLIASFVILVIGQMQ